MKKYIACVLVFAMVLSVVILPANAENTAFELAKTPQSIDGLVPNDPRLFEMQTTTEISSAEIKLGDADIAYTLADDNKTLSFNFTNISAPESGTLYVKLSAAGGETINTTIPVTALSDKITYIYNDNFETGYTEGALITDNSGTSYTNKNLVFTTDAASLADAGTAEIVKDSSQGNVLKMTTKGAGNFSVLYDSGQVHNTSRTVAEGDSGKVLVIQTKYFVPADYKSSNMNSGAINNFKAATTAGAGSAFLRIRAGGAVGYGTGIYNIDLCGAEAQVTLPRTWTTLTTVVDQSQVASGENPETFRFYVDGNIKKATALNSVNLTGNAKYVYDFAPYSYKGKYDFSEIASGTNWGVVNFTDFRGTHTNLAELAGNSTYLMIDEYKAFFADKFKMTYISPNTSFFIPTKQVVKVVFNSKIDESQLKLITLTDEEGNTVTGMTPALANGGYGIDFTLPKTLNPGEKLKLVFPVEFHDAISYQGLAKNKETTIDITIGEYTAFIGKAESPLYKNYTKGRTAIFNIKFAKPLKSTEGVTVTNTDTNEMVYGWKSTLSDDGLTLSVDITGLETANYKISFDGVTATDGDLLENPEEIEIMVIAKEEPVLLFEEDFEDGYDSSNWLDTNPDSTRWETYVSGDAAESDFVGVEAAPENATALHGNALHIFNKANGNGTKIITIKALTDEINIDNDYPGKVIIYEGDLYCTATADGSRMFNPSYKDDNSTFPMAMKFSSVDSFKIEGHYFHRPSAPYASAYRAQWASLNAKNVSNSHVKFVIDQNNELSTIRPYVNGIAQSSEECTYLTDHALYGDIKYDFPISGTLSNASARDNGTFYGILFRSDSSKTVNGDFYIDNIKCYLADAFEITSVEGISDSFNMGKDVVKINFNLPLLSAENAKANIKLFDENGNDVSNGFSVTLAESGYQAVLTFNPDVVAGNAEYKIVISPDIRDENNVGLAAKYQYYEYKSTGGSGEIVVNSNKYYYSWTADGNGNVKDFNPISPSTVGSDFNANGYIRDRVAMMLDASIKTTKSASVFADISDVSVDGKTVSANIKITNPTNEDLGVWCVVAAYGEYNEMIGCYKIDTTAGANTVSEIIPISFDTNKSGIKEVIFYVRDGETFLPYHASEKVY